MPITVTRLPRIRWEGLEGCRRLFVRGSDWVEYLVDLDEYDGNGWCGCQHFEFRLAPRLEEGERNHFSLRCKHIVDAIAFWQSYVKHIQRQARDNPAPEHPEARLTKTSAPAQALRKTAVGLPQETQTMRVLCSVASGTPSAEGQRCPSHAREDRRLVK